jgi:serine/threonine protein kinase/tetratricopeptide (TPR) repeat protein
MAEPEEIGGVAMPSLGRGAAIGRYVVLGLVGRGAMGEVYAAYDPELDRKVAVKLLRTQVEGNELTASEAKTRLLREAQAIARLSHPNVIVVHDVGSFGDRVFVAMEFVDGHTVGYWLLAAQRSWKEVRSVFMDAGRGLAAAHASQLVHRDFKVENVMVGRDGHVRVMDFGLARRVAGALDGETDAVAPADFSPPSVTGVPTAVDDAMMATRILTPPDGARVPGARISAELDIAPTNPALPVSAAMSVPGRSGPNFGNLSTELTQTGAIIGTPAYMAPEQFNGNPADERSDQFSFCVALYEGLYGDRPFVGKTVQELSDNVRSGRMRAVPDSTRVPSWLRRVVLRGLRVDPADRWPSMDALIDALQKDPGVRWRRWATVVAATAGIAGIGIGARRQGANETRLTCQVATDRFTNVWEPASSTDGRRAQIVAAFRSSGHPYAMDAFVGTARLLDAYVGAWSGMYTETCKATNVRGEQSAEVLDLRMSCLRERWSELRALSDVLVSPTGEVVANAVKAAASLTPMDRCADIATLRAAVPPPQNPAARAQVEMLRNRLATAKALEDAGQFGNALTATASLVSEARVAGYAPVLAEALGRLGAVQVRAGRLADAATNLDEAIWIGEGARYDEVVAIASIEQIYLAGSSGNDFARAHRWFRQAEAFLARMDGHNLLRAWMQNNYGAALEGHGDLEEASARYRDALKIKERALGAAHPDVATTLTNLAGVLSELGRAGEALEHSNRGVEITAQSLGWEHPDTALQLANRSSIFNQLHRYADARQDAEHALAIWERELGTENPDLPFLLGPLGDARLGLEEPAEAIAPLERALRIAERNDLHSELRKLRFALARALWQSGQERSRAVQIGVQAAEEPPPVGIGRLLLIRDRELQEQAAAWVLARKTSSRSRPPIASRFQSGPQL